MAAIHLRPLDRPFQIVRASGPRLARFACTGGIAGAIQLALLHLWIARGWDAITANPVAFLISAQANFLLSATFIWGDRDGGTRRGATLLRRWVAFHGSILGTALLNQAVFAVAQQAMPALIAAALVIGAGALVNFVVQDRLVFTHRIVS
jgi:putative flippase GtrA